MRSPRPTLGSVDGFDLPQQNVFGNVIVAAIPSHGELTYNGDPLRTDQIPQSVSVEELNSGGLVFRPAADAWGFAYASFTFQVQDEGGTAHGGVDIDPTPNTITLNVTSVNDAPVGANGAAGVSVTTSEDTPYVFTTADFGFTDSFDNPPNSFAAVRIVAPPTEGTLQLSGDPLGANAIVAAGQIGVLRFIPRRTPTAFRQRTTASRSKCRTTAGQRILAGMSM